MSARAILSQPAPDDATRLRVLVGDALGISGDALVPDYILGLDSLDMAQVAIDIEWEFGIDCDVDDVARCRTFGELAALCDDADQRRMVVAAAAEIIPPEHAEPAASWWRAWGPLEDGALGFVCGCAFVTACGGAFGMAAVGGGVALLGFVWRRGVRAP